MIYDRFNVSNVILQRIQLGNYDTKYNRVNRSMKLMDGKRGKFDNFDNTTEMLLRALGMFFKNPNPNNLIF